MDIVGVMSAFEFQRKEQQLDVDLIISTIPINSKRIPSFVVSPFLSPDELVKIKNVLTEHAGQAA